MRCRGKAPGLRTPAWRARYARRPPGGKALSPVAQSARVEIDSVASPRAPGSSFPGPRMPTVELEIDPAADIEAHSLLLEAQVLQVLAVAAPRAQADLATGIHDAMPGHRTPSIERAESVADEARLTRHPGEESDLPVGGDTAAGDARDDREDVGVGSVWGLQDVFTCRLLPVRRDRRAADRGDGENVEVEVDERQRESVGAGDALVVLRSQARARERTPVEEALEGDVAELPRAVEVDLLRRRSPGGELEADGVPEGPGPCVELVRRQRCEIRPGGLVDELAVG